MLYYITNNFQVSHRSVKWKCDFLRLRTYYVFTLLSMWPPVKKWRHSKYKRKFGNFENSLWFSQLIMPCVHMKKYTGQQGVYEKNQLQWKFRKKSQNLQSHPSVFTRYEKRCWAKTVSLVLNRTWRYALLLQQEIFKIKKIIKLSGSKNVVNVVIWPPSQQSHFLKMSMQIIFWTMVTFCSVMQDVTITMTKPRSTMP